MLILDVIKSSAINNRINIHKSLRRMLKFEHSRAQEMQETRHKCRDVHVAITYNLSAIIHKNTSGTVLLFREPVSNVHIFMILTLTFLFRARPGEPKFLG